MEEGRASRRRGRVRTALPQRWRSQGLRGGGASPLKVIAEAVVATPRFPELTQTRAEQPGRGSGPRRNGRIGGNRRTHWGVWEIVLQTGNDHKTNLRGRRLRRSRQGTIPAVDFYDKGPLGRLAKQRIPHDGPGGLVWSGTGARPALPLAGFEGDTALTPRGGPTRTLSHPEKRRGAARSGCSGGLSGREIPARFDRHGHGLRGTT